jgi:hypothetical protein
MLSISYWVSSAWNSTPRFFGSNFVVFERLIWLLLLSIGSGVFIDTRMSSLTKGEMR